MHGLPDSIDADQPPNYKDAMSRSDREEWATEYQKESRGFLDRKALKVAKLPKGARALGTTVTTRLDYTIIDQLRCTGKAVHLRTRGPAKGRGGFKIF